MARYDHEFDAHCAIIQITTVASVSLPKKHVSASYYHVSDPWYVSISNAIFALAYYVHEFRLLILCVLAISLVREIRGSLCSVN